MTQVSGDVPQHKHPMGNAEDAQYDAWIAATQRKFEQAIAGGVPLFRTEVVRPHVEGQASPTLFDRYLAGFPHELRQYHNCQACRHFINRFGGLVVITDSGALQTPIWDLAITPAGYRESVVNVIADMGKVLDVFYAEEARLGTPATGVWHHLSVTIPNGHPAIHTSKARTAGQAMAAKAEDFRTVSRALVELKPEHVTEAVRLLKSGTLQRAEKVLPQAEWLFALQSKRAVISPSGQAGNWQNWLWLHIAKAPEGFCHPRSGVLGSLIEDIEKGKSFDAIKRGFDEKMNPQSYQRPQAAPKAGTIRQAEQLFLQMGLGSALKRRFARLEDLVTLWVPGSVRPFSAPAAASSEGSLFGHLTPKDVKPKAPPMRLPPQVITWAKFHATVLPEATAIECFCPAMDSGYAAMVTASDLDSAPVLQWDRPEQRNPVSQYTQRLSAAEDWNLQAEGWAKVTAITLQSNQWHEPQLKHLGEGVFFVLEGARDLKSSCIALFPETLVSELHGVRSVVEEFQRTAELEGRDEASACGLLIQRMPNNPIQARLRITDRTGQVLEFHVDRLD